MRNNFFNFTVLLLLMSFMAKSEPTEGRDYDIIPSGLLEGKAITEVFGYWCPACMSFESTAAQLKEQRPDVVFVQIPAGNEVFARLFYTIKALGLGNEAHLKVYTDYQLLRERFSNNQDIEAFAKRHGYDAEKFMNVYSSFGIGIKAMNALRKVRELSSAGVMEGVPSIYINGRYKFKRSADVQNNINNMLSLYDG